MSQKSIKKITVTVGVGLLTATLNPSFLNHQLLTELPVEATTSKITYTDEQKITYNLDKVSMTAEVDSYAGLAGADIVIPDIIVSNGQTYAITSIGTYAFLNSGIHSVIIGNNVVDINTSAFQTTTAFPDYYKKSLTEVVLGANVKNIKTDAFSGNAISSIEFPDSVIKIATRAFANNNLTGLSFGPNITEIMAKAFQSNQITTIGFADESLTVVDSAAFSGSPVQSLTLGNGVTLADDVFNKISPLFGQLSDLPTDGIRTIYVNSNGILDKSWIKPDNSQSASVSTEDADTAPVSSSSSVEQVDVARSESTQEENSASLYPISEVGSDTDNKLNSISSLDISISSSQTDNSLSGVSSTAETSYDSENHNILPSSDPINSNSSSENDSNQSSFASSMSSNEESKQSNSSNIKETNNSSEITNILPSSNPAENNSVSDQASSEATGNSNSSISLSPSNMSSTPDLESETNFSDVAEVANNSIASVNNSSSSVLSSTSTAENLGINQSGSDNLTDPKDSSEISIPEAVSTSNQTSSEATANSNISISLSPSNMSSTSDLESETNQSNSSEATEVDNNSSTHSSDILNSDSNDSLDSDLYSDSDSDSSNLISSPNLETNQTISSKPSEVNNISENPKNVSSSNSVQENSTDHDMSTNSKSSLSSPISTISGSQPKESQSNLLNTTVEINNIIAFNNSSSENSAASNLTSYSNNNTESGYSNISNEVQGDNHSEVSHSLPSSNLNENNVSSIQSQAILESSKSSTNKISSSLPIINSTSHPQKEENQSKSSDEVKSNNNIESSLGQLNSISNKTHMNSLTSQKLSVIYTLPSKSKVMNEKNKKSNTISEEKLIKTPQKNDESQNSGQITALDLSFNKEVETMEDSKTVADKVPDNENVDQSQSDKTSTIDKDKGFFKRSEFNSKLLDSDNHILKENVLLKKHGLISDNFFIGLITILGACFIFVFILFKKKKRVKKDID